MNGKPATKVWKGVDGEAGGNGGIVNIVSLKSAMDSSMVEAKGGEGGAGGKAVAQLPGLGVEPAMEARAFDFLMRLRIWGRHDDDGSRRIFGKTAEIQYSGVFRLGSPRRYALRKGFYGEILCQEKMKGEDGAALPEAQIIAANGKKGTDGSNPEVKIEQVPIEDVWSKRALEICPDLKTEKYLKN